MPPHARPGEAEFAASPGRSFEEGIRIMIENIFELIALLTVAGIMAGLAIETDETTRP